MKYRFKLFPVLFGAMFALCLGLCVTSCGKKDAEGESPSGKTAAGEVSKPVVASEKPLASVPETPPEGPRTYEEYTVELGKLAKTNGSYGRRIAMAEETLKAREKVLAEGNEAIKAAQDRVQAIEAQLAAAQQALSDAEKALSDAFAADPEWVAAKEKMNQISKEADEARAKTMLMIQNAHKKGIHLRPKDLQQGPEGPTPTPSDTPVQ